MHFKNCAVLNMTIARQKFGKRRLKTGIVEPEWTSSGGQGFGNPTPAAMNSNEPVHCLPAVLQTHIPVAMDRMTTVQGGGGLYSVLLKL
jgi:hypothetical protein